MSYYYAEILESENIKNTNQLKNYLKMLWGEKIVNIVPDSYYYISSTVPILGYIGLSIQNDKCFFLKEYKNNYGFSYGYYTNTNNSRYLFSSGVLNNYNENDIYYIYPAYSIEEFYIWDGIYLLPFKADSGDDKIKVKINNKYYKTYTNANNHLLMLCENIE